jgi:hypothetical protein
MSLALAIARTLLPAMRCWTMSSSLITDSVPPTARRTSRSPASRALLLQRRHESAVQRER